MCIKSFFGTSENAVKTQIWITISLYVLIAIIRKRLRLEISLHKILQILSFTLFEKSPMNELLTGTDYIFNEHHSPNQLELFDLYPDNTNTMFLRKRRSIVRRRFGSRPV